ncbi:hypothetical protein [Amycolatopsis sp. NPDC051061]|uniref:hypothetical protein n=1 Tax=Amycolatopsis sp. NPDC051061 TaxID=3155042 RepID=UPI003432FB2A
MGAANDLTRALLDVLRGVPGVRPATPSSRPEATWVPWDLDALAVDINDDLVHIRVVALALPLPPILRRAEAALRSALDESGRTSARLRLVVTDLDASAFSGGNP